MPAHLELMRDAKAEMQRQSPSPGIVGRQAASQSGIAIQREQEAGLIEHMPLLASFDDWVLRMYYSMADGIKQFWTDAKYIRISDDENAPKYIGLNVPMPIMDPQTGQPAVDPMTGQPQMQMHVPAEMDVDIVIDVSPDTAVLQEEQFANLVELKKADPTSIPMEMIIEASSLPKKRQLLDKMEAAKQSQQGQPNPLQIEEQKAQIQLQAKQQMAAIDAQAKSDMAQLDAQAHMAELQRADEADQAKTQRQAALEQQKFQFDMERLRAQQEADQSKEARLLEMKRYEHELGMQAAVHSKQLDFNFKQQEADANEARALKGMKTKGKGAKAMMAYEGGEGGEGGEPAPRPDPGHVAMGEGLKALADALSRPKQLVRDASGKAVGVH
jgi:hypothetical protein